MRKSLLLDEINLSGDKQESIDGIAGMLNYVAGRPWMIAARLGCGPGLW